MPIRYHCQPHVAELGESVSLSSRYLVGGEVAALHLFIFIFTKFAYCPSSTDLRAVHLNAVVTDFALQKGSLLPPQSLLQLKSS